VTEASVMDRMVATPNYDALDGQAKERLHRMALGVQEAVGLDHLVKCLKEGTSRSGNDVIQCYVGFEPSGKAHIGWKVLALQLRRMIDAQANVMVFLASDLAGYMTGEIVSVSSQHP